MTTVKNVKVYDLEESVIACRNAMRTEMPEYTKEEFEKSLERAKKLCIAGNPHNHFLCGIRVSFDLVYPQYLSPELQRYNWIDIVTSSSKMHRLCKMEIKKSVNKYVSQESIEQLQKYVDTYNQEKSYEAFMYMLSNCPLGLELFMRVSTNYLELRNIYKQRKDHRLKADWGVICKMIEELPYAKEFLM